MPKAIICPDYKFMNLQILHTHTQSPPPQNTTLICLVLLWVLSADTEPRCQGQAVHIAGDPQRHQWGEGKSDKEGRAAAKFCFQEGSQHE